MRVMPIDPNLNIIRKGLVLWLDPRFRTSYPGSGTTWTDISGFGNNITIVSGAGTLVTFNSSDFSLQYAGTTEKVQRTYVSGDEYDLNITKKMTIEYWYKSDNVSRSLNGGIAFGHIFGTTTAGEIQYQLVHNSGGAGYQIGFVVANGTTQQFGVEYYQTHASHQIPIQLVNNVYAQVTATYDQSLGELKMYVNGQMGTPYYYGSNLTGSIALPTIANRQLVVGPRRSGSTNNVGLDGNIGTVRIYNTVLSQEEIQHNFNQQRVRFGI